MVQYVRRLLAAYARRFSGRLALDSAYTRVESEADILTLSGLCHCVKGKPRRNDKPLVKARRRAANACMARGYGWRCSPWPKPGGDRCFAPKCCEGWDCGTGALEPSCYSRPSRRGPGGQ